MLLCIDKRAPFFSACYVSLPHTLPVRCGQQPPLSVLCLHCFMQSQFCSQLGCVISHAIHVPWGLLTPGSFKSLSSSSAERPCARALCHAGSWLPPHLLLNSHWGLKAVFSIGHSQLAAGACFTAHAGCCVSGVSLVSPGHYSAKCCSLMVLDWPQPETD